MFIFAFLNLPLEHCCRNTQLFRTTIFVVMFILINSHVFMGSITCYYYFWQTFTWRRHLFLSLGKRFFPQTSVVGWRKINGKKSFLRPSSKPSLAPSPTWITSTRCRACYSATTVNRWRLTWLIARSPSSSASRLSSTPNYSTSEHHETNFVFLESIVVYLSFQLNTSL